jgi:serine/tyrosine/threonine adenylyltransferase
MVSTRSKPRACSATQQHPGGFPAQAVRHCSAQDNARMNAPNEIAAFTCPSWRDDGVMQRLGEPFAVPVQAQPLPDPHWVARSEPLAAQMGLSAWLATDDALQTLAGNRAADERTPLATVYSGHQFGVWAGQLGDGRALLLGEIDSPIGALEVQLKGSGLTPYSRMGDGRAVLRSSIREFLCSEAMHALGIPTTRALAVIGSSLPVRRESLETAAVVTRVAPSFIRFGHFEHFAHTAQDPAALRTLADSVIAHHYPALRDEPNPYAALLREVTLRTAELMAQWQAVGFCHGVMNTDNMSILGLTIDYGPFGFLDAFDPGHICNHSDHQGRYAWAKQPNVAFWNLHALAQGLMPLIEDSDAALAALEPYKTVFPAALTARFRAKLGLFEAHEGDAALIDELLRCMAAARTDFTIAFRALAAFASAEDANNSTTRDLFLDLAAFDAWALRYSQRLRGESSLDSERATRMNAINPKFVLRNHLAQTAIQHAEEGDFSETQRLLKVLQRPFDEQPEHAADAHFPPDWAQQLEVSCSS